MKRATDSTTFNKQWPDFMEFLLSRGSAVYETTNPYELARFLTPVGVGVIYINGSHRISSMQNGAREAYEAFLTSQAWQAVKKKTKRKSYNRDYTALLKRDGPKCLYCPTIMTDDIYTIEHLIPITAGGTNHLANKALACEPCNKAAGHLSVKEKIELAIKGRMMP